MRREGGDSITETNNVVMLKEGRLGESNKILNIFVKIILFTAAVSHVKEKNDSPLSVFMAF